MYLNKRLHSRFKIKLELEDKDKPVDTEHINYIEFEVAYWRKSNQIHNWFVKNVQYGVDDQREYVVSIKDLHNLLDLCMRVLKDRSLAEELLPTIDGFFFGPTDYDEYYFKDLEDTVEVLTRELLFNDPQYYEYIYTSWW